MTDALRAAAQQALECLERLHGGCTDSDDGTVEAITVWCPEVIEDLRAALAQQTPAQAEPVAQIVAFHAGDASGTVEWLPHTGGPLSVGQALYAAPTAPAPAQAEERVAELFRRMDHAIANFNNPDTSGIDPELLEEARKTLVALGKIPDAAPAAPAGWQPIETAPRDGTLVLLYGIAAGEIRGIDKTPSFDLGRYSGRGGDYLGFDWESACGDAYVVWLKPTYWMPLPAAPTHTAL